MGKSKRSYKQWAMIFDEQNSILIDMVLEARGIKRGETDDREWLDASMAVLTELSERQAANEAKRAVA